MLRPARFDHLPTPLTRDALRAAGVTDDQLRGPAWQRMSQGLYLPAGADPTAPLQRILVSGTRLPTDAAIGGWGAARCLGVVECDGVGIDGRTLLDVPACVPGSGRRRQAGGVQIWADRLPTSDVTETGPLRVTAGPRTCFDGIRHAASTVEAVVFADQLTHAGLVTIAEMADYIAARASSRGVRQARRALELCDPMARNGWETRTRMVWVLDAGLPRPRCNPPLFDLDGNLLGFPDLLDVVAGTVVEYDGGGHRKAIRHSRDNVREELFEDHGLVVCRATREDHEYVADLSTRMTRARDRGVRRDRRRDRWTLDPPPDWGSMGDDAALAVALLAVEPD
ncbi:MAG: hypothetical protein ACRDP2_14535 [Nocardioidaceae bacterium]